MAFGKRLVFRQMRAALVGDRVERFCCLPSEACTVTKPWSSRSTAASVDGPRRLGLGLYRQPPQRASSALIRRTVARRFTDRFRYLEPPMARIDILRRMPRPPWAAMSAQRCSAGVSEQQVTAMSFRT